MKSATAESLVGKTAVVKPGADIELNNGNIRHTGAIATIIAENGEDIQLQFESGCHLLRGRGWAKRSQVRIEGDS